MVGTSALACKWSWILYKIIFLTALILFIIWLYKQIKGPQPTQATAQTETPLDILKKRYAKSEIDKKEYEEKKKDLE